jgi:hypothetical protein
MKTSFRVEDRLETATNLRASKIKLLLILEENDLLDYINQDIHEQVEDEEKVKHKKKEVMTRRILVDFVREHLIPYIVELKIAKKMFNALVKLFESKNISRKLALRNQLRCFKMSKSDTINIYLTKVSEIRDQLKAIGDEVPDTELVTISLNGLPISWEPFIQSICGRKKLPKFDHLWSDCVQEETRMLSRKILQKPLEEEDEEEEEEEQAFATNARKGKGKLQKKNTAPSRKKKDLSKIQCYICDEFGHYARDCPQRKRKERQHAWIADEHPQKKTKCDDDCFY